MGLRNERIFLVSHWPTPPPHPDD